MLFDQITIVGVGLIGGSVGLAVKARGVAGRVVGVDRDSLGLERAKARGAVDSFSTTLAEGVHGSELVVACTPVDRIAEVIREASGCCPPGTIFTDGGSTKGNIVAAMGGALPRGVVYVPAHPLAGAEKNGVDHARADLFDGRVTIITPTEHTTDEAVSRVATFWKALGCRLHVMPPAEHDATLATTSHLPHVVAAALAGMTPTEWLRLSAGGFRDTTRIAGGNPDLWAAIFRANRAEVLAAVDRFTERLEQFRQLLEAGDGAGLVRWLTEAKQVRDALGS